MPSSGGRVKCNGVSEDENGEEEEEERIVKRIAR